MNSSALAKVMKSKRQRTDKQILMGLCLGGRGSRFRVLLDPDDDIRCREVDSANSLLAWLKLAFRQGRSCVVAADELGRRGLMAFAAAKLVGGKFVLRLRGDFFQEERNRYLKSPGPNRYIGYRSRVLLAKLLVHFADGILFNSEYTKAAFEGRLSGGTCQAIVYNPYVPLEVHTTHGAVLKDISGLKLLTVTNFGLWSKVEPLFAAIGEWLDLTIAKELDLKWVICGDKYYRGRLQELILSRNLGEYIQCVGFVEDMKAHYQWCDVLVHLSGLDAFPNATLEAMAEGKPIIVNAGSCGTLEQVNSDVNGMVVDCKADFIEALRCYAVDPSLRQRHGVGGMRVLEENFTVELQRLRFMSFLETLCNVRLRPRDGGPPSTIENVE